MDWLALFDPTTPNFETMLRGTLTYLGIVIFYVSLVRVKPVQFQSPISG